MVQNVVSELEKENKDKEGSHSRQASGDCDAMIHDVVDGFKEKDSDSSIGEAHNGSRKEIDGGIYVSTSEADKITVSQYSIVDNVRAMVDRVMKKKWSMFVTPPSSTPKRKRNLKTQSLVVLAKVEQTADKIFMDEYQGRTDFIGHENTLDENISW